MGSVDLIASCLDSIRQVGSSLDLLIPGDTCFYFFHIIVLEVQLLLVGMPGVGDGGSFFFFFRSWSHANLRCSVWVEQLACWGERPTLVHFSSATKYCHLKS